MTRSHSLVGAAEVGLTAVTLAAVLGMSRLFDGTDWIVPLVVNAGAAHLVAAACRRRGASLPLAAIVMAIGAAVVATWTSYWSTTVAGIPTGETWATMQTDLSSAWHLYQDVVAPAPVETGFVLASAVALWCVAYVADWAAFRLWVPFEATLPAGTLFLFTALLGTERGRGLAVGLYAAALLGFLLLHRMARQDGSSHWVAERRSQGHRSLLTAGTTLGVAAVVVGTVLGPTLPGADSPGVLDPRALRDSNSSRVTISPLVDIRARLVDQSRQEMFLVRSPVPSYWRLTSLEEFDGSIWSSSDTYGKAEGDLPVAVPSSLAAQTFEQTFVMGALAAIWLPAAFEPRALATDDLSVRYNEDSATLIVDEGIAEEGVTYRVTSASPRITAADLAGSGGEVPTDIRSEYLALPQDFSPRVRELARELTATATSPYEAALALQDHLRTFTYDLEVAAGHSDDVLEQFLFDTQRGYCEQFSGAFAAMARSIGLPARVAVGFTSGENDPVDAGLFHVRGEHAHAWPEVFLAGAGWVSFEPTPGRGMPFAEDYTGVPPAQAAPGNPGGSEVAPPTTLDGTVPTLPTTPTTTPGRGGRLDTRDGTDPGAGDTSSPSAPVRFIVRPLARLAPVAGGVALAYLTVFPVVLLLRRRLRRRRATTPAQRIALAWSEAVEAAALVGFHERRSDTFHERANHLASALADDEAAAEARSLARHLEQAAYSADGADDLGAELAEAAAATVSVAVRAASSHRDRTLRWLDPRPFARAWRDDRALRQRRITTTVRADMEAERQLVGTGDR